MRPRCERGRGPSTAISRSVPRWQDWLEASVGPAATAPHPFPCDAAALHHIIDHGWMWVLRFDNGITSAGFSLDPDAHPLRPDEPPAAEWARLLSGYPSIGAPIRGRRANSAVARTGRLQRRLTRAAGPDWALLPHAAGFLDAWLSPGIAQTLYAVERLGRILAEDGRSPRRERRLAEYGESVLRELAWVDEITGTCFACFDRFEVMVTVAMLYFVAAIYCEEREHAGQASPDAAFLLADDGAYRAMAARVLRDAPACRLRTPLDSRRTSVRRLGRTCARLVRPWRGGICIPICRRADRDRRPSYHGTLRCITQ